jgi:hypothetical protein
MVTFKVVNSMMIDLKWLNLMGIDSGILDMETGTVSPY